MIAGGRRVALVAGGGAGIGAATAIGLARDGCDVVVLDPGVSVEGRPSGKTQPSATVDQINGNGGRACLKRVSVTDNAGVASAIGELLDEFGRLDVVVNAAGFDRRADYLEGTAQDWADVLDVHVNGHLNLLAHAVPALANSGGGRFLGFTSGAGWRAGHGNAYGCAKRVICVLAWSLASCLPRGLTFNVISPIADTRMTHAHARDPAAGLNPANFPPAEHIAPLAVHLTNRERTGYNGEVLFTDGSDVTRVGAPRLLEAAGFDGSADSFGVLVPGILAPAEADQRSAGGAAARRLRTNGSRGSVPLSDESCAVVVTPGSSWLAGNDLVSLLAARGLRAVIIDGALDDVPTESVFATAEDRLRTADGKAPARCALILTEPVGTEVSPLGAPWRHVVRPFSALTTRVLHQAAWMRALAHRSRLAGGVRVVSLQGEAGAADVAASQAIAQLGRGMARRETGLIHPFSLAVRGDRRAWQTALEFASHLVTDPAAIPLAGAELVVGDAWVGVNAHPQPASTVTFDGPLVPEWLDQALLL